jgi:hypothetical protein
VLGVRGEPLANKSQLKAVLVETRAEADAALARIREKSAFDNNFQVYKRPDGRYTIVENADIKPLPHGGTYKTEAEAAAKIGAFAEKVGIDPSELTPVFTKFLDRSGNEIEGWRLALGVTERDVVNFREALPHSFEHYPIRTVNVATETVSAPTAAFKVAQDILTKEPPKVNSTDLLDRLAFGDSMGLGLKKVNTEVRDLKAAIEAIKACTGV